MPADLFNKLKNQHWLIVFICLLPIGIYIWVFQAISLNINYLAFDDILILGIIPGFAGASWLEKWHRLTTLFPEHRLVFSRSVILLLFEIFGRVNLIWLMVIGNICWAGCAFLFYKVFKKMHLSIYYFAPILWIWFNIQSFENIFWGVSSLCNFGVLLFVIASLYQSVYNPKQIFLTLFFAVSAVFTYGNGLMVFPIIALLCLLTGRGRQFFIVVAVMLFVTLIYFINFTPITKSLDFKNPDELKDGFLGTFGFIGSMITLSAYGVAPLVLKIAVGAGMVMISLLAFFFRQEWKKLWNSIVSGNPYQNREALFGLSLALFVGVTSLVLVYKRIPSDAFEGVFKGRYRMYSALACVALYFSFLALCSRFTRQRYLPVVLLASICLNLCVLHYNFGAAVNNRRSAVAQEFNARYNPDWLGLKMFGMDRAWFEKIRSFYQSSDPLAEGWHPSAFNIEIKCDTVYTPDKVALRENNIEVSFNNISFKIDKDYSDAAYVLIKSADHVYISSPNQMVVPLKTVVRRQMYFSKGVFANFHKATIEPGTYSIYLLIREGGSNKIYCTNKTWVEED